MPLRSSHLLASLAGVVTLAGCATFTAPVPGQTPGAGMRAQSGESEYCIAFRDPLARQAALTRHGLRPLRAVPALELVVVRLPNLQAARGALTRDAAVRWLEPVGQVTLEESAPVPAPPALVGPSAGDDQRPAQWALDKLAVETAWQRTSGRKETLVAVVDTGIDDRHPDLTGRVRKGRDFVNGDDDAFDDNFHGTHCAGILAANRGNGGVVGVAPEVTLLPVKVLSAQGSGTYDQVAAGLVYAADQGASIISVSLGTYTPSQVLLEAVRHAQRKGALVVAGMGNQGSDKPFYPAAWPDVLAVGATTVKDERARYSNTGSHLALVAPGSDILSTIPDRQYARVSGTSMATPHVAGVAALLKSAEPRWTAANLRQRLLDSAVDLGAPGMDPETGRGRLSAARALLPSSR
ncbi:MAG: S8 family peptidase [Candidatus Sericytochromatia bacterium]|nr:S8 family peptidase [Candidatus Sericytochromatia bacterium]